MHASIRKYRGPQDQLAEVLHKVDELLAPRLEEMEGFIAYECVDCGDGIVCSMTICSDEKTAEQSLELSRQFVREDLAGIEIEPLEALDGEVAVSRARNEVLEPAHA